MPEPDGAGTADALRLLGLAHRAGRVAIGTRAVLEAGTEEGLAAVVVARDATDNAVGRLGGVLRRRDVGALEGPEARRLGSALGRERVVVVGIEDAGFARKLAGLLPPLRRGPGPGGGDRASGTLEHAR